MKSVLEAESKLTDRYQTTVPEAVRRALKLGKRDKIRYSIRQTGEVVVTRATPEAEDAALGQFLEFLARDIASHPERLEAIGPALSERIKTLIAGVEVDLDNVLPESGE